MNRREPETTEHATAGASSGARWEWRVIEPFPSAFVARSSPVPPNGEASRETYILSAASPHNVKIRDGQLDVKRLEATGPAGIERWRPVFKAAFPVPADALGPVWRAWNVEPAPLERASYTAEQLVGELVPRVPQLRAVTLSKRRARFAIADCRAERALLDIEGEQWESLAIEDDDRARLLGAVRALGDTPPPRNYPAALERIVGPTDTHHPSPRVMS